MQNTPKMTGLTLYYAVRARFPGPSRSPLQLQYDYCIGGALYKFMHSFTGPAYPSRELLAGTLMQVNTALGRFLATAYASRIIRLNDAGEYEGAWLAMKAALTHDDQAGNHPFASTATKVTA